METFPLLRHIAKDWWTVLLRGILAILFGVLAFAQPVLAGVALVTVFGVYALIDGTFAILGGVKAKHGWGIVHGVVAVLAGIAAFVQPVVAGMAITTFIGAFAIVTGIVQIATAWRIRHEIEGEGWIMLGGLAAIVLGGLLVARPLLGGVSIVLLVGAYAIAFGLALVFGAFRLKKLPEKLDALVAKASAERAARGASA
jgi:uncharacterized membrane protein HdeD (DUF308 family)